MQVGTFYLIGPGIINKKSQLLEKTFLTFFKQTLTELLPESQSGASFPLHDGSHAFLYLLRSGRGDGVGVQLAT